jgi:AraC family transcriptional regulator
MDNTLGRARIVVPAPRTKFVGGLTARHDFEAGQSSSSRRKAGALNQRRLTRVLEYIEKHIERDLTVDILAEAVCLSKYHFARAFHVATGAPPRRYLRARRLEIAKAMLCEERGTLAEIAAFCRYSSQANFSRAFRGATGIAPGKYRRTFTTVAARIRRHLEERME